MKKNIISFQLFLFFLSYVSAASDSCCKQKVVGGVLYILVESGMEDETSKHGCKDGCVYNAYLDGEDPVDKYCFKYGDLPVTCLDGDEYVTCYRVITI